MAVEGCLMLTETILYLGTFFTGIITAITVGISRVDFSGDCMLFAEVAWCNSSAFYFSQLGNNGVCGFSIGLDIVTAFYALVVCGYHVSIFCQWVNERRWFMLPGIIISSVCLTLLFIDSCILSIGFKKFCSTIVGGQSMGSKIMQCSDDLSGITWNALPKCAAEGASDHGPYTSSANFFGFLTTAQGASWFGVLFWLLILISLVTRRIRDRPVLDPSSDKAAIVSNVTI